MKNEEIENKSKFIIKFQKVLKHAKYNYLLHYWSFGLLRVELARSNLFFAFSPYQPVAFS